MKKKIFTLLTVFVLLISMTTGCGAKEQELLPDCPFSVIKWSASPEDVILEEGTAYTTYDSIYKGTTYTYEKSYMDLPGTIKYMFDDQDALKSIAWTYTGDIQDLDSLQALYDTIHTSLTEKYGDSGYQNAGATSSGDVWYLETGNVLVSTMITSDVTALQYSYLHPDVSHERPAN